MCLCTMLVAASLDLVVQRLAHPLPVRLLILVVSRI